MKWPLGRVNLSFWDRLKVAGFVMNPANQLTQGKKVEEFEKAMAKKIGCEYAIFVGNGSLANTLLAMYVKDHQDDPDRNEVILPALTWQTSCSPWIREGFKPVFLDINKIDWSLDYVKLDEYLKKNHKKVAAVFPTSLLGFSHNVTAYQALESLYPKVKVMFDNCENTFGRCITFNISSYFTSTTSTYVGHQISSVEGGFIFTNSAYENDYFRMARNHGMTRGLIPESQTIYANKQIDPRFDFYCLGSNFRNTEINAMIGLSDMKRYDEYFAHRVKIYCKYLKMLRSIDPDQKVFDIDILPDPKTSWPSVHAPFCIPIICKDTTFKSDLKIKCFVRGIETRPIISGFLGNQTAYKKFFKNSRKKYENAKYLDDHGFYLGLHSGVSEKHIALLKKTILELIPNK